MSSYVTSPFVLEERRLQGIVNKCNEELQCALRAVERQQEEILRKQKEQEEQDAAYHRGQQEEKNRYEEEKAIQLERDRKRKIQLKEQLKNLQIELEVYQKKVPGMDGAVEHYQQLLLQMEDASVSLDDLERKISDYIENVQQTVMKNAESQTEQESLLGKTSLINYGKQKKGVSLEIAEEEDKKEETLPVTDLFQQKIDQLMAAPYGNRFSLLGKLKEEFLEQPEYAKTAYAVKNMPELDAVAKQMDAYGEREKKNQQKRQNLVNRYRAVCELLGEMPDDALIIDEKSTRILVQKYNELFELYKQKKQQAYISNAVSSVMKKHGIAFYDGSEDADKNIMHFQMDMANLEISGLEHNQLIMEVSGEYEGNAPTLNEKRRSVSSAQHFCSIMDDILDDLEYEYGVIFGRVLAERPSEETIVMKKKEINIHSKAYRTEKKVMKDTLY